jgi:hypothetical protein
MVDSPIDFTIRYNNLSSLPYNGLMYLQLTKDTSTFMDNMVRALRGNKACAARSPALVLCLLPSSHRFCSARRTHLRGLEKIWVDDIISEKPWKNFVETLKNEWIEFILYVR